MRDKSRHIFIRLLSETRIISSQKLLRSFIFLIRLPLHIKQTLRCNNPIMSSILPAFADHCPFQMPLIVINAPNQLSDNRNILFDEAKTN